MHDGVVIRYLEKERETVEYKLEKGMEPRGIFEERGEGRMKNDAHDRQRLTCSGVFGRLLRAEPIIFLRFAPTHPAFSG